jgi:hypothetical protein
VEEVVGVGLDNDSWPLGNETPTELWHSIEQYNVYQREAPKQGWLQPVWDLLYVLFGKTTEYSGDVNPFKY